MDDPNLWAAVASWLGVFTTAGIAWWTTRQSRKERAEDKVERNRERDTDRKERQAERRAQARIDNFKESTANPLRVAYSSIRGLITDIRAAASSGTGKKRRDKAGEIWSGIDEYFDPILVASGSAAVTPVTILDWGKFASDAFDGILDPLRILKDPEAHDKEVEKARDGAERILSGMIVAYEHEIQKIHDDLVFSAQKSEARTDSLAPQN